MSQGMQAAVGRTEDGGTARVVLSGLRAEAGTT